MYHNIERSAFRPHAYVGYARGVWHIARSVECRGRWRAINRGVSDAPIVYAQTQRKLSAWLDQWANSAPTNTA